MACAWAGMMVLAALALEAAPDAVDVQRRAGAASLEGQEAGLAEQLGHADAGREVGLVEGQPRELRVLLAR